MSAKRPRETLAFCAKCRGGVVKAMQQVTELVVERLCRLPDRDLQGKSHALVLRARRQVAGGMFSFGGLLAKPFFWCELLVVAKGMRRCTDEARGTQHLGGEQPPRPRVLVTGFSNSQGKSGVSVRDRFARLTQIALLVRADTEWRWSFCVRKALSSRQLSPALAG